MKTSFVRLALAATMLATPIIATAQAKIYPSVDDSPAAVKSAIAQAKRQHKRVIVDFGGDWCGDCQVLNIYFHQSPNKELLAKYFVLVDVNVGHIDQNIDMGDQYGVVLSKGVPALAVLDGDGKVIYAQKNGEFENMRNMKSSDLTDFLNKWKK
jgi:thiol:disulfide interchange protein